MGDLLAQWAVLAGAKESAIPLTPSEVKLAEAMRLSTLENPWFTVDGIAQAMRGLAYMLRSVAVDDWVARYSDLPKRYTGKKVAVIAAGNVPMVAFHDVLCTALAGHKAVVKLSSQDQRLLPALFAAFEAKIEGLHFELEWETGRLQTFDAVIATGGNNTARYFEYYFGTYPHIIRKNRNSVAILTGQETPDELKKLGEDIFFYFGLGCRNVSKVYVHASFDMNRFFDAIFSHHDIVNHHKYANNYDYYKALWLMNQEELLDNGFLLLRRSEAIASPPGVLYYERYENEDLLRNSLDRHKAEIQCVVSCVDVPFGKSQAPELWDYADGADTMEFLMAL
jgi:hypothetical protein